MNILKKKSIIYPFSVAAILFTGCAHDIQRKELAENLSPSELIEMSSIQYKRAKINQADVLSPKFFGEGADYYYEAAEMMKDDNIDNDEVREIRENIEYSMAYFEKSLEEANEKKEFYKPILESRRSALEYGALQTKDLKNELDDIDDHFRSLVGDKMESADEDSFVAVQKEYLDLRTKSLKERELGQVKRVYNKSIDEGARFKVPEQQEKTWKAIELAQNSIKNSPTNRDGYEAEVIEATRESIILSDLMSIVAQNKGDITESVAMKLYEKDKKIDSLDGRVDALRTQVTYQYDQIKSLDNEVFYQNMALMTAKDKMMAEQEYKEVQDAFSKEEADVYRKGSDIVIRLKEMNFKVGKSALNQDSKKSLNKVENILKNVDSKKVVVVGHTDSTGPDKFNKDLSQKRAQEVVRYLKKKVNDTTFSIEADSFDNPVAVNKTSEGRKMNRRVDIILKSNI